MPSILASTIEKYCKEAHKDKHAPQIDTRITQTPSAATPYMQVMILVCCF